MQYTSLKTLIGAVLLAITFAAVATPQNRLPDIGTAGSSVVTVDREQAIGDMYMRQVRATAPLVNDPVLDEYLRDLGLKLVRESNDVRFPFTFFWVNQNEINAFAFFGGYVGMNTGLMVETRTESELASVIGHEIAHITQRHLARNMENMQQGSATSIGAMIGAILLGMVSPDLGMAALSGAIGGLQQMQINYTRLFEQEADRIGLNVLTRAGFDPQGAPDFFGRLAEKYRYSSRPPEMLLTHPLSESRIADTRQRADQLPSPLNRDESHYWLAKYRIQARHLKNMSANAFTTQLNHSNSEIANAARYGLAIVQLDNNEPETAEKTLAPLLAAQPMNTFYLDVQTDILLAQKRYDEALALLEKAYMRMPNEQTITMNFANAALTADKTDLAIQLLREYLRRDPDNVTAIDLLANAYQRVGDSSGMYEQRAYLYALYGNFDEAINNLHNAHKQNSTDLERRRLQARVEQLMAKKRELESMR
ncbi:peptidase M48 [Pseudidiomarina aestuarii]|uniref:Putative beta-barrel assembly-enhancing protease n=1 Tax=Pseudidiomarina aestuarii TaxID=624146 RepID=A0A7Z6ZT67_9GAMM|nr:M48 family metalloprotease [Pseudidiomarina aestuarii]RUO40880.1 peptidase M48 [Pseudidiomarina aestuarii]